MLVFRFIIFAVFMAGYSYGMSVQCYGMVELECPEYDIAQEDLPKTVDGLQNFCSKIISYGHCVKGVYEKCTKIEHFWDREEHLDEFKKQLEFIESSCDEESTIFQTVADNLHCMMSTITTLDGICQWGGLNDTIRDDLYHLEEEEHYGCVLNAWIFYCITSRFDVECGKDAEYVASEILDHTDYVSPRCKDVRGQVSYFEDAFKSEFRRGKYGDAALPGIMEAIRKKVE